MHFELDLEKLDHLWREYERNTECPKGVSRTDHVSLNDMLKRRVVERRKGSSIPESTPKTTPESSADTPPSSAPPQGGHWRLPAPPTSSVIVVRRAHNSDKSEPPSTRRRARYHFIHGLGCYQRNRRHSSDGCTHTSVRLAHGKEVHRPMEANSRGFYRRS